jgi:hypothetical protein
VSKQPDESLEIVVTPESGFSAAGTANTERAREAFDALGTLLVDTLEPFRNKISGAVASASEVELKIDLALKGEGKWVVVSLGASASVSVKLVWKK